MKTYKLAQPLKRVLQDASIPYQQAFQEEPWILFDEKDMREKLRFYADETFEVTGDHTLAKGTWSYQGGDAFQLKLDGAVYGLHLVHLDNNLLIFELHDTQQYFILVSETCLNTIHLTTLKGIEDYIKRLNLDVKERKQRLVYRGAHGVVTSVVPILVMGGLYHAAPWMHKEDDDRDAHKDATDLYGPCADELDEEVEDELLMDEADELDMDDEEEDLIDDDEIFMDDDEAFDNVIEDDYDEYGGLSEEEIIYDYLESQDEE